MPLTVNLRSELELEEEYKDTVMVFKQDEKVSEGTADMIALHRCAYQVRKNPAWFCDRIRISEGIVIQIGIVTVSRTSRDSVGSSVIRKFNSVIFSEKNCLSTKYTSPNTKCSAYCVMYVVLCTKCTVLTKYKVYLMSHFEAACHSVQTGIFSTQNALFHLQCGHLVSSTLNTMHIIVLHCGSNIMNLLRHLSKFFSKHIVWVAKVGRDMLDKKGLPVEYYANHVVDGNVPLDSLGILCIARNWYIHIAVFLKYRIWTT